MKGANALGVQMKTIPSARRMVKHSKNGGEFTHYHCGMVNDALKADTLLSVIHRNRTGTKTVLRKPHRVHRESLTAKYGSAHPQRGQGKYIDDVAFIDDMIVGVHHVHPFLPRNGCFYSIIHTLKLMLGDEARQLSASVHSSAEMGEHLLWHGDRTTDDCVLASQYISEDDLWERVNHTCPAMFLALRKGQFNPRDKFTRALGVLSRPSEVIDISTGRLEFRGGVSPYAKPLEQCGFAIDRRYLTYAIDDDIEQAQYYYRLCIGRSRAYNLRRSKWVLEGPDSEVAFLNSSVKLEVRKALRQSQTS